MNHQTDKQIDTDKDSRRDYTTLVLPWIISNDLTNTDRERETIRLTINGKTSVQKSDLSKILHQLCLIIVIIISF